MKKLLFTLTLILCCLPGFGKVEPVKGIEPSGTLPILYINTENSQEVNQKVTYIDAEWWLDSKGFEGYESIGSAEEPLKLGIRGRGNTSWLHDGQKPYKLKLDKKTSILGMGKNKHWALLAKLKRWELYNELLGFEMGRQLGMDFVPQVRPVEVVLNDTYIGLYMLTETIRIDDNRLETFEQPELNEDEATIGDGWLVEIDNNTEENQVAIPQPQDYNLRVTHHTPEVVSDMQRNWLIDQMTEITERINTDNLLDTRWEELVDIDALVKHLIVQESLTNYDAYSGSCYLHKDVDEKWTFGPLWDLSFSTFGKKQNLIAKRDDQHWIGEFYKFPVFKKRLKEIWDEYYAKGTDWMRPFLTDFYNKIKDGVAQSVKVWPDIPLDAALGVETVLVNVTYDMDFTDKAYQEECITRQLSWELIDDSSNLTDEEQNLDQPIVTLNGLPLNNVTVLSGGNVIMAVETGDSLLITEILINGEKANLDSNQNITFPIEEITEDTHLEIHYSNEGNNSIDSIGDSNDGEIKYYNINGLKVDIDSAPKGIYIEIKGGKCNKIVKF